MPHIFGEVDVARLPHDHYPEGVVLFDDNFLHEPDLQRWESLLDKPATGIVTPRGLVGWDRGAMVLLTEDQLDASGQVNPQGQCSALKRLTGWPWEDGPARGLISFEVWFSWWTLHGPANIRRLEFSIDTANPDGSRRYYTFGPDLQNQTELEAKWQVRTGTDASPVYNNISDDLSWNFGPLPFNEGKRNISYFRGIIDLGAERYEGLQVNGVKHGILAEPAETGLEAYQGSTSSLNSFANGLNFIVSIRNRTDTVQSASEMHIHRARGVLL